MKLKPIDKAILKVIVDSNRKITPSEVAYYVSISPATAKRKILKLAKKRYIRIQREGMRLYCSPGPKHEE